MADTDIAARLRTWRPGNVEEWCKQADAAADTIDRLTRERDEALNVSARRFADMIALNARTTTAEAALAVARAEGRQEGARATLVAEDQVAEIRAQTVHTIEHDGFVGTVQGTYVTREGKTGVVLQQIGTRVVHVYGEKWLKPLRATKDTSHE